MGSKYSVIILALALTLILHSQVSHAKPLIQEKGIEGASASSLSLKINKPKAQKGAELNGPIQLKACWLNESVDSISALDKNKKKIKFKLSKDKSAFEFTKVKSISYPISLNIKLKEERSVISRGSLFVANGRSKCESIKGQNGKVKEDCSASFPVDVRGAFSGFSCNGASDLPTGTSEGTLVFSDGDDFTIRPIGEALKFSVLNGAFFQDLSDFTAVVNEKVITAPQISLTDGILSINAELIDGKNSVSLVAVDSLGFQLSRAFEFWAGKNNLKVNFSNVSGSVVNGGELTLKIADDPRFTIQTNFSGSSVEIPNLPSTTVSIVAKGSDGSSGFAAAAGNDVSVNLILIPPVSEETVSTNSEFDGWSPLNSSSVELVNHKEDEGGESVSPATSALKKLPAEEGEDRDAVLHTSGEGTQFMVKVFRTNPASKLVRIRYRFQTSEFPGGYFGSKFNDFYNVSLRSSSGASILDDGSSMNALGRAAFSPSGFTVWKSTVIPVNRTKNSKGDVVEAAVAVANVADSAYQSQVIVDKIEESPFAITASKLYDIDNKALQFLSLSSHNYFGGFTYINGTIALEGDKDDSLSILYLQVMDGAKEVAAAEVSTQASSKLYNKKFGKTGKIELKNPILLFKIFPNVLNGFDLKNDTSYTLVIQAVSKDGHKAHKTIGTIEAMSQYKGASRYDGRDELLGGDDWALPSVLNKVNDLSGLTFGDFSNMNGGQFAPHDLHENGRSVDAWIEGYNALDSATAQSLINLLDSGLGSRIRFMYVAFRRSPGSSFYNAIREKTLKNGRKVENVILPDSQHTTHFHLEF